MRKFTDVVQNPAGPAIGGATITVKLTGTSTLATIYSDEGTTVIPGSTVTTDSNGEFSFYVEDGRYDIYISGTGIVSYIRTDIEIADMKSHPTVQLHMMQGANFGAKLTAALALLPSTGGTIDGRGVEGAQTVGSTVSVNKPCCLLLGGVTVTSTINPMFTVSKPFDIIGIGTTTTILTSSNGGDLFTFTGNLVKSLTWRNFKLQGGSGSSRVFAIPDFTGPFDMSNGQYCFDNLWVNGFGGVAMTFGQSCYYLRFPGCFFTDNQVDVSLARFCEYTFDTCHFGNLTSNNYQVNHVQLLGGTSTSVFKNCNFENDSATASLGDVLITPVSSGEGFFLFDECKFGEEGDIASRYKIRVAPGSSGVLINLKVTGCEILSDITLGNIGIQINGQPSTCRIDGNIFAGVSTLVSDNYTPLATVPVGNCSFRHNQVYHLGTGDITVFTNGGRGFEQVDNTLASAESNAAYLQTMSEPPELRNLVAFSEAFNSWTSNGTTVTTGQTDPFATTRACLLTKTSGAFNNVATSFSPVASGKVVVSVHAKPGTANKMVIGVFNQTTGIFLREKTFMLDSGWNRYKFPISGLDTTKTYSFVIYPDGFEANTKTISVFGAQVAYFDSDYLATSGAIASTTVYGHRWERGLQLGDTANLKLGTTGTFIGNPAITMSGATPSVAAGNFFFVNNGGLTTVTNFTGGTAGQFITLLFGNTNTTIQQNANIKLKGGIDATGATSSCMTLCFTSVWTEVSRSF